jgi:hypothetical protein
MVGRKKPKIRPREKGSMVKNPKLWLICANRRMFAGSGSENLGEGRGLVEAHGQMQTVLLLNASHMQGLPGTLQLSRVTAGRGSESWQFPGYEASGSDTEIDVQKPKVVSIQP